MSTFSVELAISRGWCILNARADEQRVQVRGHWLNDSLTDLVSSLQLLLDGRQSVSTRWQHEVSGGHFLDFVADPRGGVGIAVSELAHGAGSATVEEIWSAARGETVFSAHVPLGGLVTETMRSLRRIRVESVDSTGYIEHWQHSFPQALYESVEGVASVRFGYKPQPTAEFG